jgi:YbbR domain-containing protein
MPDWLTKDFHWKAFSLLMAVGIWLTVSRESPMPAQSGNRIETPYGDMPVAALSAGADVHQAQIYPQNVTVTVSGDRDAINRVQRNQIHPYINLTGLSSAESLSRDVEVSLPPGITLVNIDPPQVAVTLPKQP